MKAALIAQGAPEEPIKTRNGKMSHSVIHPDETRLDAKKNPLYEKAGFLPQETKIKPKKQGIR